MNEVLPAAQGYPMKYAVVIEQVQSNYSAYVPDLPGCVATGTTVEDVEIQILEAVEFPLDGIRQDGESIPPPRNSVGYVEVAVR